MTIYSRKNPPPGFYIYAYLRSDGTPYYIGKGSNGRAWMNHGTINLPSDRNNIIVMESNLTNVGSLALERFYIRWYGRKDKATGILRNMTDGGDSGDGRMFSQEQRDKISKAHKDKPKSTKHRMKIGNAIRGNKRPDLSLRNASMKGVSKIWTPEMDNTLINLRKQNYKFKDISTMMDKSIGSVLGRHRYLTLPLHVRIV